MKRVILALGMAVCAPPVLAQSTVDADLKAFAAKYVSTFNKGDTTALAGDFYRLPGASADDLRKKFDMQLNALRGDEFGKMELYGAKTCSRGDASGRLAIDFVYNFTYGGVMPPGEQVSVFDMSLTADGWRIVGLNEGKPGEAPVC
ncbi:MAG TPA: hypothetical protein VG942_14820 [Hyphomonadaceae bacterium]|nr:hypothetical protein [Hyphomonadaceae bacterium]